MIDRAVDLLSSVPKILVFTGAGMSTASGIPDFRGPDGVWNRVDPSEFTLQKFIDNPDTRKRSWEMRNRGALAARPNAAHIAVAEMWSKGRLTACATQNVDGLHQRAGLPDEVVVEVHGNAHRCRCLGCTATWPTTEILDRVAAGDADPHCEHCGSIIKPAVISFGEQMPMTAMEQAFAAADECGAVISAGSTLGVYPAADIPLQAVRRGVPYVVVNQGETAHDDIADVLISGDVTQVLPAIVKKL